MSNKKTFLLRISGTLEFWNTVVQHLPLMSLQWCHSHFGSDIFQQRSLQNKVKLLENHPANSCSIVFLVQEHWGNVSGKKQSFAYAHFRHKNHLCFMLAVHSFDRKIIGHKTHTYNYHKMWFQQLPPFGIELLFWICWITESVISLLNLHDFQFCCRSFMMADGHLMERPTAGSSADPYSQLAVLVRGL